MSNAEQKPKKYFRSRAKEWVLGESGNGKPHIAVSFVVKDEEGGERYVSWRGFFIEGQTDRTIESLRHMGFEGDDLTKLEGLDKNEVELVVEDEEYEGKTFERVRWINKIRGPAVKQKLEGVKLSAFAAQMKSAFRAHDAANGKRATTKPAATPPASDKRPEPPPLTDDDMPF